MDNIKISNLSNDIFLFENIISDPNKILNEVRNRDWEFWGRANGKKIGEMQFLYKNENILSYKLIDKATKFCFNHYLKETKLVDWLHKNHERCDPIWHEYNFNDESYHIRKWDYPMHGMEPHSDFMLDKDGNIREDSPIVTICGYLNDDYTGGEIMFSNKNISIKPPAGSALVFLSKELHEVKNLENKNRYMWTTFLYKKNI